MFLHFFLSNYLRSGKAILIEKANNLLTHTESTIARRFNKLSKYNFNKSQYIV